MAANVFRLRRSLALSSAILNHSRHFSVLPSVAAPSSSASTIQQNPISFDVTQSKANNLSFQFISSRSFSSRSRYNDDSMDGDQISPDAILFEGCDYNHWLITMDFPKDPKPSPEEMVETYVQTAAKVLGSVEEAKKKIYACSTTTYNGFQVEVSEEVSEQFKSIPGVVFVLPDSYIDPVNKEYGGDKYINGTIIPRPPPIQYGRNSGRYNDRNREYNRPPRGPMTSNQVNYNQGDRRTYPQRDQGNFANSDQRDNRGQGGNFAPPPGGGYNQGVGGYRQGSGGQYDQGRGGQYGQGGGGGYGQGSGGQYGQSGSGNYGQGTGQYGQGGGGGGNYGQGGSGGGNYGQGGGGNYGHGGGGNYGAGGGGVGNYGQQMGYGGNQSSPQYRENPGFSQAGQRVNNYGQQGNYEVVEEAEAFKER